ncbi:hypothetical protein DV013_004500 [Vibrio parahaemolyticus]|nr:hypothetical protein [Vibrio parahaemolyticus]
MKFPSFFRFSTKIERFVGFSAALVTLFFVFWPSDKPTESVVREKHIYHDKSLDLEVREPAVKITVRDANYYLFLVRGSLTELKSVVTNNSNTTMSKCSVYYQYKFQDFFNNDFYYVSKAFTRSGYNSLDDYDRFKYKTGGYYSDKVNSEFALKPNTDVRITAYLEPFFAPPDQIKFYVKCAGKISNSMIVNKNEIEFREYDSLVYDWYYSVSEFFVAPYR